VGDRIAGARNPVIRDMDEVFMEHDQNGKSRAQNLRLGPEVTKVEAEIANYRRFTELCEELVEVMSRYASSAGERDKRRERA